MGDEETVTPDLQYTGTNGLKMAFEDILRQIFSDPAFIKDERYRYNKDEAETGLKIYRKNPKRVRFYPCITISAGPYDASLTALGDNIEDGGERYDDHGAPTMQMVTGQYVVPIILRIESLDSTDDREFLTDYLIQVLRILARDLFSPYGIAMYKIAVGGEDEGDDPSDTGRVVYGNTITVDVYTDFNRIITLDQAGLIEKVVIDVLGQATKTSKPEPLHKEPPF